MGTPLDQPAENRDSLQDPAFSLGQPGQNIVSIEVYALQPADRRLEELVLQPPRKVFNNLPLPSEA
jgi:hypothetical protein